MAEIARGELTAQELLSHEMGLHTEKLRGRSHQIFFDFNLNEAQHGFSLPNAYDVDYNKRAEIDASNLLSNTVNVRIRELMQDPDALYHTMAVDLYGVGTVLQRKYRLLRVSFTVLLIGMALGVLMFVGTFAMRTPDLRGAAEVPVVVAPAAGARPAATPAAPAQGAADESPLSPFPPAVPDSAAP